MARRKKIKKKEYLISTVLLTWHQWCQKSGIIVSILLKAFSGKKVHANIMNVALHFVFIRNVKNCWKKRQLPNDSLFFWSCYIFATRTMAMKKLYPQSVLNSKLRRVNSQKSMTIKTHLILIRIHSHS
jgi:hypothetical protein